MPQLGHSGKWRRGDRVRQGQSLPHLQSDPSGFITHCTKPSNGYPGEPFRNSRGRGLAHAGSTSYWRIGARRAESAQSICGHREAGVPLQHSPSTRRTVQVSE